MLFVVSLTAPVFADCWAALALNQNKRAAAVGTGATLWEAQKMAMDKVGMPGASIWLWAKNKYVAMAADQNNPNTFGMSHGLTQAEADQNAIDFCRKMQGRNCKIVTQGGCGPIPYQQQENRPQIPIPDSPMKAISLED